MLFALVVGLPSDSTMALAEEKREQFRISEVNSLDEAVVVTIGIANPKDKYVLDRGTTLQLAIKGKKERTSAKGVLLSETGGMPTQLVPLDTCRVFITKESVMVAGSVRLGMAYRELKGIRRENGELLIPIVFEGRVKAADIESVQFFDDVVPMTDQAKAAAK
jgi:hypothetical protein